MQKKAEELSDFYDDPRILEAVKDEVDIKDLSNFLNKIENLKKEISNLKKQNAPSLNQDEQLDRLIDLQEQILSTGDLTPIRPKETTKAEAVPEEVKGLKFKEKGKKSGEVKVTKPEEGTEDTFVAPPKKTKYSEPPPPIVTPEEVSARIEASGQAKKARDVAKKVKKEACE